jgi:hypothetical protein
VLNLGLRRNFTWRFVVADVTQALIGVDFLSHFDLLVDCKHNRLLGRHSRFIPVSRAIRTTSMVSTRPTSEGRDPHQPVERNHPSIQYHLPRLKNLRRGFPAAGRTNNLSTGLPSSQDRQSPLTFSRHAELPQANSAPRGSTPGTTSRRPLRTRSQGLPPHHLDTGAPQGLRKVQGEFVTRHSTGTPQHIHATCTHHQAAGPHAVPPPPIIRTTRSGRHVRFPARFNDRATISAEGGGVMWQPHPDA